MRRDSGRFIVAYSESEFEECNCSQPVLTNLLLCRRLQAWRARKNSYTAELRAFSDRLRQRTWNDMASQMADAAEECA